MRLEWSRLRVIDAVARAGSVARAAELLHLTGPAVSQQLRRIEREVGAPVVAAEGRGLRLTSAGSILADYARQVAELMQRAENDLNSVGEVAGTVRIGAIASYLRNDLAPRLEPLRHSHQGMAIEIEDGETDDHLGRLAAGHLDLVIAESWASAPLPLPAGVVSTVMATQSAYVALPADHRCAASRLVDIAELAEETWSTCARGSRDHQALVQTARRRGVELDIRHFVADVHTQQRLVAHGLAVACLAFDDRPKDTADVVFRELVPTTTRDVLLITDDRTPSRAVGVTKRALLGG